MDTAAASTTDLSSTEHLDFSDGEDIVSGDDDTCFTATSAVSLNRQSANSQRRRGPRKRIIFHWTGLTNRIFSWLPTHHSIYERVRGQTVTQEPQSHDKAHNASEIGKSAALIKSLDSMLLSSWMNILLIFVPIGLATYLARTAPAAVFVTNAIAIIPLSALLTTATERIAQDAGDTIGALLNISLGNLVELIILLTQGSIVALQNGHIRIVQASILGSILVNLLLILGSALLACSIANIQTTYNNSGTQLLGCLLFVSVFAFLMPTAFDYTFRHLDNAEVASLKMSRISAFTVLAIYLIYVVHELKPKAHGPDIEGRPVDLPEVHLDISNHDANPLPLHPRTISFADDYTPDITANACSKEGGPIELDNVSKAHDTEERGRPSGLGARHNGTPSSVYQPFSRSRGHSRSVSLGSSQGRLSIDSLGSERRRILMRSGFPTLRAMRRSCDELNFVGIVTVTPTSPRFDMAVSVLVLIVASALMSMCAEFLVSTIDEVTHEGHLSESLIGLIILPIVGNMAEYITVVTVAVKEKLDLAIAVSVGSSIQIALCVTPLTVLAGWILDRDLVLTFNFFEMATLVGTVLLVNLIILGDGTGGPRSNALRGGLICGCYAMIGIGALLSPEMK